MLKRILSNFAVVALSALTAHAGSFFCDFNAGLPPHCQAYGSAIIDGQGGVNDTGALKLTVAHTDQTGSFCIDSLDGKKPVSSFVATFKAYIGGGSGADGMSFHFAPSFPSSPFADLIGL